METKAGHALDTMPPPDYQAQGQAQSQSQQPQLQQPAMAYTAQSPATATEQYAYGQQPPEQGQERVYQQAVPLSSLGAVPAPVDCPSCGQRHLTRIEYKTGNMTHLWAFVAFCFTCCCFFVPYLMNGLKDVEHRCANCGTLLATWHRSGHVDVHMHP